MTGRLAYNRQVRPHRAHEAHHRRQRRVIAQVDPLLQRNGEGLANGRKRLRLLDRVDAQVGLHVEVEFQHILRVARLVGHHTQHLLNHHVCGGERVRGCPTGGRRGDCPNRAGSVSDRCRRNRRFVGHVSNVTGRLAYNRQVRPHGTHEAHHGG